MQKELSTRFVVLRHVQGDGVHFDLMIQSGTTLSSWKCLVPPEGAADEPLSCTRIQDHRLQYLDYEGPVSNNRGEVTQHDAGTCEIMSRDDQRWLIRFDGSRLRGRFELAVVEETAQGWSLRAAVE